MTNAHVKPSRNIQEARQEFAEKNAAAQAERRSYGMQRPSVWIAYARKMWECEDPTEIAPLVTQHIDDRWASPLVASKNWGIDKFTAVIRLVPDDVQNKLFDYKYPNLRGVTNAESESR